MKKHRRKAKFVKHERKVCFARTTARVHRVKPDPSMPWHMEVRIARTRTLMRAEMARLDGVLRGEIETECMGLVRSWYRKKSCRPVARPGGLVARIYLNAADLRKKPSEIVAHECTHAGMAWARFRGANLRHMPGEEVLCYATGRLVAQVNRIAYAERIW